MRRILFNMLKLQMLMLITISAFGQGSIFDTPPQELEYVEDECWSYTSDPNINFTIPIYFVNLEFETLYDPITGEAYKEAILPCDLHISVKIGPFPTMYTSAIEGIDYLSNLDVNGDEYFVGHIPFEINEQMILDYFIRQECYTGNAQTEPFIRIDIIAGLVCLENGIMEPLDLCEDYDDWSPISYYDDMPDPSDCIATYEQCLITPCFDSFLSNNKDNEAESDIIEQEISIVSFDNHLVVSSIKDIEENMSYIICDLNGNVLKNKNLGLIGSRTVTVEYNDLPSGMYIFTTNINGEIQSKKIVKF